MNAYQKPILRAILLFTLFTLSLFAGKELRNWILPEYFVDAKITVDGVASPNQPIDLNKTNVNIPIEYAIPSYWSNPTELEFSVDDCINFLEINQKILIDRNNPYCIFKKPIRFAFAPFIEGQEQHIKIEARNTYGAGGFYLHPIWNWDRYALLFSTYALLGFFISFVSYRLLHTSFNAAFVFTSAGLISVPLLDRFQYEILGPLTVDSYLYWGVGQAIIGNRRLYPDFFETKPPLMGLLSTLAITSPNPWIVSGIIQVLFLCILLLPFFLLALSKMKEKQPSLINSLIASSLLSLGILITNYTATRAGGFQIESFGAAMGTIFLYLFITRPDPKLIDKFIAGFFLAAAVGFKDPFGLIIFVASIYSAKSIRHFYNGFIIPAFIGLAIGLLSLLTLGCLHDYFFIYLNYMIFGYAGSASTPYFLYITTYSKLFNEIRSQSSILAWGLSIIAILSIPLILEISTMRGIWKLLRLLFALSTCLYVIGLGHRFYPHYFIFAVPLYAVIIFDFYNCLENQILPTLLSVLIAASTISFAYACSETSSENLDSSYKSDLFYRNKSILFAEYVDALVEACKFDSYLWLGSPDSVLPIGMTKTIPLAMINHSIGIFKQQPLLKNEFLQKISKKNIVVVLHLDPPADFMDGLFNIDQGNFNFDLPSCAPQIPNVLNNEIKVRTFKLRN